MLKKKLTINGVERMIIVDPESTLAQLLRKQLCLTGTKVGCGKGECGSCSVIMNGKVAKSCIVKMKKVPDDARIITINLCRCTGYKPLVDAVMDAAKLIRGEIKKEALWFRLKEGDSIFGTPYVRPSTLAKVTGTCNFGADLGLKLPEDTLHIKLVQAEVSHANILSIDTSEAEKMPGVFKVITYKDVPGTNRINGLAFPTNKGDGKERPILNDKKVFQYGDALAMVLADTPAQAEDAAKKVKVELENVVELIINTESLPSGYFCQESVSQSCSDPDCLEINYIEKEHLITVLNKYNGNISQSALALGIRRNTLYSKIKKYEIRI